MTDIVILPGIGGSGELHWQTRWEKTNPRYRRFQPTDWNRPDLEKIIWSSEARSIVIISPTKTRMIDRLSGEASVSVCVPSGSTVAASRVDM